jgi:hypothetical protein
MSLEGAALLDAKLRELADPKINSAVLRAGVVAGMRKVLTKAKSTVPIGTVAHKTYKGRLVGPGFASRSLRVKGSVSRDKQKATALLGVAPEAFYAVQFIELGTSKYPATPWLVPAFESMQEEAQAALRDAMFKRLTKVLAKRR